MSGRKLKDYFPMIRTREQILQDIESDIVLKAKFESFTEDRKKEFLDFCTGERGVKILYDSFFNAVMNPDIYPERVRHLISALLGKEVTSFSVMQRSSFSIGDDKSLVIMDIVGERSSTSRFRKSGMTSPARELPAMPQTWQSANMPGQEMRLLRIRTRPSAIVRFVLFIQSY